MCRAIGFRAWVKPLKRYANGIDTILYHKECDVEGGGIWSVVCEEWDSEVYECDNIVVEQYTGLKDKNGKEIYEGDIVRTTDRVTVEGLIFPVGVVEFKQQAFWICNVPSERPDFTHNETLLQYWETDLEVIGNIHENPELLEVKNDNRS